MKELNMAGVEVGTHIHGKILMMTVYLKYSRHAKNWSGCIYTSLGYAGQRQNG
jgi:hypothetical protein